MEKSSGNRTADPARCGLLATTTTSLVVRAKLLGLRRAMQLTISSMPSPRLPLWYRHSWWLPGAYSAFAVALAASALNPTESSVLLPLAILCALPWSLVLLLLDVERGLADIGAVIVLLGLYANAALLWWSIALLRARFRERQSAALHAAEA